MTRSVALLAVLAGAPVISPAVGRQVPDDVRARAHRRLVAETDQHLLARAILEGSAAERAVAVAKAEALGADSTSDVRLALIACLEREGRVVLERDRAIQRGATVPELDNPEFVAQLTRAVAALRDRASIPALVRYGLGTGTPAVHALASFGEDAVHEVVAAVLSEESLHETVDGGLIVLRLIVENAPKRPLSGSSLAQIRRAATKHLATGEGHRIAALWWAIDLASVLNDTDLDSVLREIASNPRATLDRGVLDAELIARTRQRATDRLARIPPQPRGESDAPRVR